MSVPAICTFFVFVVILTVAELFIRLGFQSVFHKFLYGFFKQILYICHTADITYLQQLADLFSSFGVRFLLDIIIPPMCSFCFTPHWRFTKYSGRSCVNRQFSFSSFFKENGSYLFTTQKKIVNSQSKCNSTKRLHLS